MEDSRVVKKVLRVVPKRLKQVAVAIEMLADMDVMSVEELVGRLQVAEDADAEDHVEAHSEQLLLTEEQWEARRRQRRDKDRVREGGAKDDGRNSDNDDGGSSVSSEVNRRPRRPGGKCYNCGVRGHLSRDCRKPRKEEALLASADDEPTLLAIPEDSRRKEYQDAVAKAQAEEETRASQRTRQAEEDTTTVKAGGKKTPSDEAAASEAQASLENLLSRAKGFGTDFSWEKLSTQLAGVATQDSDEVEPKAQIATVRGQAKAKKLAPQRAVVKPAAQKTRPTPKQPESKPDVRPVFGGLFKQETIFVDED
ncbi:hypothetical protein OsJ_17918 [Oryza sativa Japonica Group]|uniref:CCHC-type domain-containing protein n=1 Tax=Oryza sativa subsp. japonica TaxID=39947 RepID=B9FK28_ORYSJ|nr:hypothetical protein OsJ_17918 [Oryza sativa Japonica Group]